MREFFNGNELKFRGYAYWFYLNIMFKCYEKIVFIIFDIPAFSVFRYGTIYPPKPASIKGLLAPLSETPVNKGLQGNLPANAQSIRVTG